MIPAKFLEESPLYKRFEMEIGDGRGLLIRPSSVDHNSMLGV